MNCLFCVQSCPHWTIAGCAKPKAHPYLEGYLAGFFGAVVTALIIYMFYL